MRHPIFDVDGDAVNDKYTEVKREQGYALNPFLKVCKTCHYFHFDNIKIGQWGVDKVNKKCLMGGFPVTMGASCDKWETKQCADEPKRNPNLFNLQEDKP